jgi:hypothetical protein
MSSDSLSPSGGSRPPAPGVTEKRALGMEDDGLALGDQLLSGLELPDDLLGCVTGSFHGGVPGPAWPDEDSHSPLRWTGFSGQVPSLAFGAGYRP